MSNIFHNTVKKNLIFVKNIPTQFQFLNSSIQTICILQIEMVLHNFIMNIVDKQLKSAKKENSFFFQLHKIYLIVMNEWLCLGKLD